MTRENARCPTRGHRAVNLPNVYYGCFGGGGALGGVDGVDGATLPPAVPLDGADCAPGVSILTSARYVDVL